MVKIESTNLKNRNGVGFWFFQIVMIAGSICGLFIMWVFGWNTPVVVSKTNLLIVSSFIFILLGGIIISFLLAVIRFKKYGVLKLAPGLIILIIGLLFTFYPLGFVKAISDFNQNNTSYKHVVKEYKNEKLRSTYEKSKDWVNLPVGYQFLSESGYIKVQHKPLTLLFYKDKEPTENPTGILYREGIVKAGPLEDSTVFTFFMNRKYKIWEIEDNWYWLETYTDRISAP